MDCTSFSPTSQGGIDSSPFRQQRSCMLPEQRGSARSIPLWSWTLSIMTLLENKGWFLTTVHAKGANSVLADALSRDHPVAMEWELGMNSF